MSTRRPHTLERGQEPRRPRLFHLRPWLAAMGLLACTPSATSTSPQPHPDPHPHKETAPASSSKPEQGVFKGATRDSVIQGQRITPIAWVHADIMNATQTAVTVLFLYEWQATPGEQVKMDTITMPIDVNGNFSGKYADIQQISGYVIGTQVRVTATINNQKGKPSDQLTNVDLPPASPPSVAPQARAYPVIGALPVLATQPIYSSFWNIGLNVVNVGGKPAVQARYDGPPGSFTSEPITVDPSTKSFRGKATRKGSNGSVTFAGTFLDLQDGASPKGAANFPILTQSYSSGTSGYVLTDSVGSDSILWLESSTTTRSGVVLGSSPFSTAATAWAQVVKLRKTRSIVSAGMNGPTVGVTNPPNDPYFAPPGHPPGQYPYPTMNGQLCCTAGIAPTIPADAWAVPNASGTNIQVAVLDTGVVADHEDLAGKVLGGHNSLPWPWWADWLREYIPNNWRTDSSDLYGHGTGVAGVVTANRNNGIGVAGTVANARVIPVRVLGANNSGTYATLADGLLWLLDNNLADIFNTSLISQLAPDPTVAELSRRAVNQGRLFLAGSGNSAQPVIPTPAGLPDVISVASSENNNAPADYSGAAINLDMMAPGGNTGQEMPVLWKPGAASCTDPVWNANPNYCMKFGTSFATPYASAVAAMLLSLRPNLRRGSAACTANPRECVGEATSILQATGLPIATPDWAGQGVTNVNLVQALTALVPGAIVIAPPTAATAINTLGCNSFVNCTAPGLLVRWTAAGPPPPGSGLVLQGYLVYRNGALQLTPGTPNPIIVPGAQYYDTQLPVDPAGGALVPGRYTYTVTALYQNGAGVKRESLSAPAMHVNCTGTICI
ncbi:S8 family peptidase [Pendulispora albinea]|uniref:S8 family serine peptidase n=1 Tax=Pendulispora albinea TaxID=2741071 RepID=A0ABZ2LMW0_9BACT